MYLTSKTFKNIVFAVVGTLVVLIAYGGVLQSLLLSFSEGFMRLSRPSLQKEEERLNRQILTYQMKLGRLENLITENEILRKALAFKERAGIELIGAEVIAFSPSSWHRYIFIGAGKNDGVVKDMLVVDQEGYLVGKVAWAEKSRAQVILLTNPDFQTPVLVNNKIAGLLQGNLSGTEILYIEKKEDIKPGDLVHAALSSFEPAIKAGKITRVRKGEDELFSEVGVDVFFKKQLPRIVFVVK